MRLFAFAVALLCLPAFVTAGGDDTKPLTPEAAAKKVGEKCTVEMKVLSVGQGKGVYFLNSKEDYKDAGNFTFFINKEGVESLQKAKIDDPVAHFKGKTVRATGMVKLYNDRPEIVVEKAEQLQIVEKK
jgi:DNA/RNA endonuclease YhcR with UshA esterase domain